jgi:hypothetical protein
MSRLVAERLTADVPIRDFDLSAHDGDLMRIRIRLAKPAFLPPIQIRLAIERQLELPTNPTLVLKVASQGVASLAAIALPFVDVLPAGVQYTEGRFIINVRTILERQNAADVLNYLTEVKVTTAEHHVIVRARARLPAAKTMNRIPRDAQVEEDQGGWSWLKIVTSREPALIRLFRPFQTSCRTWPRPCCPCREVETSQTKESERSDLEVRRQSPAGTRPRAATRVTGTREPHANRGRTGDAETETLTLSGRTRQVAGQARVPDDLLLPMECRRRRAGQVIDRRQTEPSRATAVARPWANLSGGAPTLNGSRFAVAARIASLAGAPAVP